MLGNVLGGGESALHKADTVSASTKLTILVRGGRNKEKIYSAKCHGDSDTCCEEK